MGYQNWARPSSLDEEGGHNDNSRLGNFLWWQVEYEGGRNMFVCILVMGGLILVACCPRTVGGFLSARKVISASSVDVNALW